MRERMLLRRFAPEDVRGGIFCVGLCWGVAALAASLLRHCGGRDPISVGVDVVVKPNERCRCYVTAPISHINRRCVAIILCCIGHGRDGRSEVRERGAWGPICESQSATGVAANPRERLRVMMIKSLRLSAGGQWGSPPLYQ